MKNSRSKNTHVTQKEIKQELLIFEDCFEKKIDKKLEKLEIKINDKIDQLARTTAHGFKEIHSKMDSFILEMKLT